MVETPLQPTRRGDTLYHSKIANANENIDKHRFQMSFPFTSTFQLCPFALVLKQLHQATEHVIMFFSPIKNPYTSPC